MEDATDLTSLEQSLELEFGKPVGRLLTDALEDHPTIRDAALSLGIRSRTTFYRLMDKHGIRRERRVIAEEVHR